ncbi:MAG: response regulator [Bdellovibrionota bacterium]
MEDSADDADLLIRYLQNQGIFFQHERIDSESALTDALQRDWDMVICDYNLPSFNAMTVIARAKVLKPDLPLIVVSGSAGEDLAVETIRAGASDYIMKENLTRLIPAIERSFKERVFHIESRQVEEALKRREEELRQAQKLEAIGQLAGGIAHDFNNIMAAILMRVDFMLEDLGGEKPSPDVVGRLRTGLEQIRGSGNRATDLTRQLLQFSRKQLLLPKVLSLNAVIRDFEKMLRPIIEENIEFELALDGDVKNIKVDPGHIEQVIMNLVINGRDAMPKGGMLKISTRNTALDAAVAQRAEVTSGPYVLLEVQDSGTGIAPEVRDRIFEPFFTTKPVGKGTGLGLSNVYGIVKQNHGLIFVDSEVGRGTTFQIYFPAVDEEIEISKVSPQAVVKLTGTETILLVEDESDLREVVSNALRKNGYCVLTASDGEEAMERLKAHGSAVHLIITDVVMPNMGGLELASNAQKISKETKVLFHSGYTEDKLIQSGIRSGQIHFLGKPYNMKGLLGKVRSVLGSLP